MKHENNQPEIIIDEEFKLILPALDEQTYAWLEENILEYGCREPLVLWNGTLIDGHNRYEILMKHERPFNTVNMEFDSRDDVLIWIISTQISRRNLNPLQLSYYRGLHYSADKRVVTNPAGKNQYNVVVPQNEEQPRMQSTVSRLAELYKVSRSTIERDAQIANAINSIGKTSPDIKTDILSGKTRISRRKLQELSSGTEDDITNLIGQITDGTLNSNSQDSDIIEMPPWEMQFSKMIDEFRHLMKTHAKTNDTNSVKATLRQYITMLEDLYNYI